MIYDVTVPITNTMPVWPSDPPVRLTPKSYIASDGTTIRLTNVEMGSHTGTHIDAPWHFVPHGRRLNEIPLETLVGTAHVFYIGGTASIRKSDVERLPLDGVERVLFKTDNSGHWQDGTFYRDFVYLEPDAATVLVRRGIKLVGIDYLSIDAFTSETHPTHCILLEQNVIVVEGLDLNAVPSGEYQMAALPLKIHGADGAPTRVILLSI
jgi:arylformamidase